MRERDEKVQTWIIYHAGRKCKKFLISVLKRHVYDHRPFLKHFSNSVSAIVKPNTFLSRSIVEFVVVLMHCDWLRLRVKNQSRFCADLFCGLCGGSSCPAAPPN